ncbi:MAG: hypothetical protein AAFZ09_01390 [Pseudomonadota bacterium]
MTKKTKMGMALSNPERPRTPVHARFLRGLRCVMWKIGAAAAISAGYIFITAAVDARQVTMQASADALEGAGAAALVCEEQSVSIGSGNWLFGSQRDPLTDVYAIVSDPAGTCRHPDVRAAAGYEPGHRACYLMRNMATGDADLPLSCAERVDPIASDDDVDVLRCSGWNTRMTAMVDGGFSMTTGADPETQRSSRGVCSAL